MPADLSSLRHAEFAIDELAREASRRLRSAGSRPADGRISEVLDARGIRFYQTLGILDRPLRYDGRRAVYGYRHLLQLLATRQLQHEGHSLQLIQAALPAKSTAALEAALTASQGGPAASPRPAEFRRMVTAEVAPGVTVTIDPDRIHHADRIIARIADALWAEREQDS
jgi:DNA-binding transcriptional MerR regulator